MPKTAAKNPLRVVVTREPWSDFFLLTLPNGHTEELETDPCKTWFKERGANMDAVDKALDHCWNFSYVEIVINNAHEPKTVRRPFEPEL